MRRNTVLGILTAIAILCPLCACFGTGLGAVCLFSAAEDETAAERFILRFDEDMPESGLNAFSAAWNPDPVSERDRIYVVSVPGEDGEDLLRAEYGDHLVYCCPDLRRTVSSLPTDPELKTSDFFQQIHVPEAWELVEPDPDLTVAVLDTGVFREHEDFEGVRILDGYDAVEKHAGVDKDTSGHGTAVIGIIAASPGNGLGSSGICPGVRILPVRVSSGENAIYSSDFVNGLRYAVDAGARIINLSFGGYSFSAAENDAVQYALSKQCLLIAAAGNDGDETHRGEYCYPASYEGVISVGSCGRNGERSAFSQYNDDVWILAPGEQIPFPAFDEEGGSVYRRANGSSYAASIVTGIAGLVLSAVDGDVRFGPDEFRSLLASDRIPAVGDGCGVVDALRAVSEANEPQISGVVTGQTYRTKVIVRFNRGTALLDGEPFSDGDTVYQNGVHRLTVTDGETKKTVSFRLSYVPATYSVSRDADSLSVTYRGGTATMDGFPYESGEPVTGQGVHRFVLTDPFGERKTVDLTLNTVPPVLSGAEDGAVYDRPVRISTAGGGKIRLNGGELPAGGILTEDGDYELTLSSANGTEEHTVRFRIERGGKTAGEAPARSDILLCERYGWFGVYGEGTDGLSVRNLGTGEMLRTVGSGRILRAAVAGEKLILLRDGTAEVLDASLPDSEEISASAPCDDFAWADGLLYLLADGFLSVWDPETDERTPVTETGANAILTDGNVLALYRSETGALTGPDGAALGVLPGGSGRPLLYGDLVFDSGTAYEIDRSGETDELRVRFSYLGSALACRSGFLYTTEEVCSVETGELAGHCGMPLTAVLFGESVALVRRTNGQLSVYPAAGELFAPLPESVAVSPEQTSEYLRTHSFYDGSGPDAVLADGDRFCVLFSSARRYVLYEGRTPVGEVRLPFEPGKGAMEETNAAFLSSDGRLLWESGTLRVLPFAARSLFYAGGRLRILGGDRIYVLDNGVPVDSGIAAETADGKGNLIVWTMDGQLFGSDGVRTAVCPCDAAGLMTDGTYAVAGKDVYRYEGDVWSFIGTSELRAEALSDGCAAGPDGLFLLDSLEPLSRFDAGKRKVIAAGTGCGILILTGDDALLQCFSPDLESRNAPFWTDPGISGCDNGKLYRESARITFSFGAGFVDGNRISSGSRVTDAGEHVFRLVLPCGIVYESAFRVVPALTGIAFLRQNYRLPVNESGTFAVVYLPEEASRVSVYYTADSDCIALDGEGHFRALREGRATVTARTEDGRFSATCSVEVTSAVLLFSEESGYRVDRMNGLLLGVPGNTSSDSLLAAVRSAGRTELSSETAGTGSVVRLFGEDGQILDELTVAVAGDADGDGYVTLSDLLLFETWMERPDEMTPEAKAAADIDGSGTVTSRDMNRLRSQLLYESGFARRDLPPESRDGQAELLIPSSVRFGEPVRVLIGLTGCETAVGFSGRLTFDPDRWTYDRTESYGWDLTESANRKGQVSFLASGDPAGDLHPVLAVYLIPKETEDGEAPAELLLRDLTVVWEDRTLSLPRQEKTVVPEAAAYGEPNIGAEGMDPFDPARREYELSLPYDTYFVDLTVTRPENVRVDVGNTVFRNGNHLDVSVRFLYPDGTEEAYLIRAFRDGVRPKNGDSSLAALQAEGYELDFSPDRTEYRITVPRGTEELHLSFEPARKESTVRTEGTELNGDLEENVVRVIVTAEDGTETVYRILVSFEGDVPEESVSLPPVSEPPVSSGRIGWILLGLVAVGLASAVTGLILQRTKNKNR